LLSPTAWELPIGAGGHVGFLDWGSGSVCMLRWNASPIRASVADTEVAPGWAVRIGRALLEAVTGPADTPRSDMVSPPSGRFVNSARPTGPVQPPRVAARRGAEVELSGVATTDGSEWSGLLDLSFRLHAGERVAIVGRSGSGRSTLASVLLGLRSPSRGRIRIDGCPANGGSQSRSFNGVEWIHEASLSEGCTIAEAVGAGDPQCSESDICRVMWLTQADSFVGRLSLGLHTRIGVGGVRPPRQICRRLAVARALLRSAPVLLVDDRGLETDPSLRGLIDAAWMSGDAGTTAIFICDNLSRMERFDRILVLREGRLVECGHHSALMVGGGEYAALHAARRVSSANSSIPRLKAC